MYILICMFLIYLDEDVTDYYQKIDSICNYLINTGKYVYIYEYKHYYS